MRSSEQCMALLDRDEIKFKDIFTVDCQMNHMSIHSKNIHIQLNESQKRLLVCLIEKINGKRDIINIVWYENHQNIRDNNYHQLIFQLRALFQRNSLPGNLLVTIPYYGLKINEELFTKIANEENEKPLTEEPEESVPLQEKKTLKGRISNLLRSLPFSRQSL